MKPYRTVTVSLIMIATAILLLNFKKVEAKKVNQPLSEFPRIIGQWQGEPDRFDSWFYEKSGVDDSILSNFRDSNGNSVQLYVGYYESQREGDIIHSPKNCMVGGGWNIVSTEKIKIANPANSSRPLNAVLLKMKSGAHDQLVLYWYYSRGRTITSEYFQKIYLVLDAITRQRTDGSFIRLISPVLDDEQQTLESLKKFAVDILPIIEAYIPS